MKSAIVGYPYIGEKNEGFTIRDKFQRNTMTSSQFKNEMMKQNLQSLKSSKHFYSYLNIL